MGGHSKFLGGMCPPRPPLATPLLKPSLAVVLMAALNKFNSNHFSVNNRPLAKKSQYIAINT